MTDNGSERMHRRDFLVRAGAAGLALPLGLAGCGAGGGEAKTAAAGRAAAQAGKSEPKVALCTIAFQERPLYEVLELAAQVGFDGVEPWGKPDHLPLSTPDDKVREVKAKLDNLGLACSHFGSYVRLGEDKPAEQQEADMKRALEITQMLGTHIIRIWAGSKNSEDMSEDEWKRTVEDGKKFCTLAEPMEILLAMEMHPNCVTNRSAAMIDLIERVGSPNLKANYQILNETEDPYERARAAGPYVVMCHAQNDPPSGGGRCLISEGVVDFQKIYDILAGFGFKGYFEVEFVKGESYEEKVEALKKDYATLRAIHGKA